ncbi:MAG: FtsH protease activity modulator HflK [Deferribacteres bacterium]|nr:FtsH protease activity modulator HflK [candidate division KSB1 bacterium]MCB9509227.1 FtsH protease activity modulator HflK [Deferribacteres bacterium]
MAQGPRYHGPQDIELPKIDKRFVYLGIIAIIGLWLVLSSVYTVNADEVGVVQRFGKYTTTTQPGLHFKIPFGIETVKKVKVQRNLKAEFGFRTRAAGVRTTYASGDFSNESLMLTGDLNSAIVEWIVQYRIKDPVQYLFRVRNVDNTLRNVSEAVMRLQVGDHSVDEVIISNRQQIAAEVQEKIQALLDEYETGIDIVTVNLQDVNPPKPVQPAFNSVNEAKQEKERIINEALQAYNKAIPQAEGVAEQAIREAEGYAINRVNRSKGDADRFLAVWREYNRAKDVTRRRLYLETMLEILPQVNEIYVVDEGQQGLVPLLQLQKSGKDGQ